MFGSSSQDDLYMIETTLALKSKINDYIALLEAGGYGITKCRYTGSLDYVHLYLWGDWMKEVDDGVEVLVTVLEGMQDKEFTDVIRGVWILTPFYMNRRWKMKRVR